MLSVAEKRCTSEVWGFERHNLQKPYAITAPQHNTDNKLINCDVNKCLKMCKHVCAYVIHAACCTSCLSRWIYNWQNVV